MIVTANIKKKLRHTVKLEVQQHLPNNNDNYSLTMSSLQDIINKRKAERAGTPTPTPSRPASIADQSSKSGASAHTGTLPKLDPRSLGGHPAAPSVKMYNDGPKSAKSLQDYLSERRGNRAPSVVPGESASRVSGVTTASTKELMDELQLTKSELQELRTQNAHLNKETAEIKSMLAQLLKSQRQQA